MARCAPRRVPMTAWISSARTVRAVGSISRPRRDGRVTPFANGLRSRELDGGGRTDCFGEPALEDGMEGGEGHAAEVIMAAEHQHRQECLCHTGSRLYHHSAITAGWCGTDTL